MTLLDHLRILVALAVLKTTPAGKTYSSYIISLRDAFSSSKTPFELWKDRAQKLEKECMDLRASLAKLQIRSFIDTHASTQLAGSSEYVVPSSSDSNNLPLTKKKSKKKSDSTRTAEFEDRNLSDILKFGRIQLGRPFDAMDRFLQLCSLSERPGFPKKAFLGATRDVCSALSSALEDATRDGVNLKRLQVLQVTLCAVVDKAVPLVLSWVTEHDEALTTGNLLSTHVLNRTVTQLVTQQHPKCPPPTCHNCVTDPPVPRCLPLPKVLPPRNELSALAHMQDARKRHLSMNMV